MDKKVFFFDIDGTLLSEITREIPESAKEAIRSLHQKGHLTFINTGRTICSVPPEIKEMPFAGFLCGCGTYISYEYEELLSVHISMERGLEILALMERCLADPIMEGTEDCYFPRKQSRFSALEMTRHSLARNGLGKEIFIEDKNFIYDKFVFFADEETRLGEVLENLEQDMVVLDRQDGFYEVMPKAYSKAKAIDFVLKHFDIPEENAYVFGDSSNDLSMFQEVGHAIAMEMHDPVLDPYAEYVTKAVEEDGILHALKHYNIL